MTSNGQGCWLEGPTKSYGSYDSYSHIQGVYIIKLEGVCLKIRGKGT